MQYSRIVVVLMTLALGALAAPVLKPRDNSANYGNPSKVWYRGDAMRLDYKTKDEHDGACVNSTTCNIKFSTGTILRSDLDYGNPDLVIFEDVIKRIRLNYGSKDNWCGEYECHILQEPVPIP